MGVLRLHTKAALLTRSAAFLFSFFEEREDGERKLCKRQIELAVEAAGGADLPGHRMPGIALAALQHFGSGVDAAKQCPVIF
jgi:hypothetical protein